MLCAIFIEMWLSLVERCVRDAEAAGSNPVISTIKNPIHLFGVSDFYFVKKMTGFERTLRKRHGVAFLGRRVYPP